MLVFCLIFVWASSWLVDLSWGQTSPVMEVSMGWVYCAGILGFGLAILGTVRKQLAGPSEPEVVVETGLSHRA